MSDARRRYRDEPARVPALSLLPPANDAGGEPADLRGLLRADHRALVAQLDSVETHDDLARLRRAWIVHALAEESVIYRALETAVEPLPRSADRFVEHEVVGGLFDRLAKTPVRSLEWRGRLNVARDLVTRHLEAEERELHGALVRRFAPDGLQRLAERYVLVRDKLALLEDAKAA